MPRNRRRRLTGINRKRMQSRTTSEKPKRYTLAKDVPEGTSWGQTRSYNRKPLGRNRHRRFVTNEDNLLLKKRVNSDGTENLNWVEKRNTGKKEKLFPVQQVGRHRNRRR